MTGPLDGTATAGEDVTTTGDDVAGESAGVTGAPFCRSSESVSGAMVTFGCSGFEADGFAIVISRRAVFRGSRAAMATATEIPARQSQKRNPRPRCRLGPDRVEDRFLEAISTASMIGQFDRPIESRYTHAA